MKNDTKNDTEKNTKKYMTWVDIFIMLGLIVCFSIAVPFLLNVFYGRGCPLIDAWDKSDLMGYYGSIMTAAAAIAGVYFTLDYSKFKQMEYESLKVKPFLEVRLFYKDSDAKNIFEVSQNEIYAYKDFYRKLPIISSSNRLPKIINDLQKKGKYYLNKKSDIIKSSIFLYLSLENIGLDKAKNIKILFNGNIIAEKFDLSKNENKFIKILIVFDKKIYDLIWLQAKNINIKISYENIYSSQVFEHTLKINYIKFNKNDKSHKENSTFEYSERYKQD